MTLDTSMRRLPWSFLDPPGATKTAGPLILGRSDGRLWWQSRRWIDRGIPDEPPRASKKNCRRSGTALARFDDGARLLEQADDLFGAWLRGRCRPGGRRKTFGDEPPEGSVGRVATRPEWGRS